MIFVDSILSTYTFHMTVAGLAEATAVLTLGNGTAFLVDVEELTVFMEQEISKNVAQATSSQWRTFVGTRSHAVPLQACLTGPLLTIGSIYDHGGWLFLANE